MNDNAYLFALGSTLLIFALVLISMMHDKDVKVDCIKATSRQHYPADEIYELCGVKK
jgi:hypothetical protein